MAANEVVTTTVNAVQTITLKCENCRRPLGACTVRVGPSARQNGWRCGRPACAAGNDEAPGSSLPGPTSTTTTTVTADPTCWKGDARDHLT